AQRFHCRRVHSCKNAPRPAHGGVGRRLSAIWAGAPQRICYARSFGSFARARSHAAASLFVRAGARLELLGFWSDADLAAYFMMLRRRTTDHILRVARCACPER